MGDVFHAVRGGRSPRIFPRAEKGLRVFAFLAHPYSPMMTPVKPCLASCLNHLSLRWVRQYLQLEAKSLGVNDPWPSPQKEDKKLGHDTLVRQVLSRRGKQVG